MSFNTPGSSPQLLAGQGFSFEAFDVLFERRRTPGSSPLDQSYHQAPTSAQPVTLRYSPASQIRQRHWDGQALPSNRRQYGHQAGLQADLAAH